MKKILKFLNNDSCDLEIGWTTKDSDGMYYPSGLIRLNIVVMVVSTFLHEYYHDTYPKLSEKEVEDLTGNKLNRLTKKQINVLYNQIMLRARRK